MTEVYFQRTDGKPICHDCQLKPTGYKTCMFNNSTTLYLQSCKHYSGNIKIEVNI